MAGPAAPAGPDRLAVPEARAGPAARRRPADRTLPCCPADAGQPDATQQSGLWSTPCLPRVLGARQRPVGQEELFE